MAVTSKKKILMPPELISSAMGAFFEEQGFELFHKYVEGEVYQFAVDNVCPEVTTVPRLQTNTKIDPKLAPFVRSYFDAAYLESSLGRKLLSSYYKDGLEFDLVDRYSKDFKNIYAVKVHEYLNMGFFIDSIIVEAYKAKFDIEVIRNYLNAALNFAFKKVEVNENSLPIDISYSHNGEAFTIQISMDADSFKGVEELSEYMDIFLQNSAFFDVAYFQKKNKLTISSLLFNEKKLNNQKAYFFTEILKRSLKAEGGVDDSESEMHSGLNSNERVLYIPEKNAVNHSKKIALARKFALFIKNYRSSEESPKKVERLELIDVDYYLSFYPKQGALKEIDEEIKNFIFKLIKDEQLFSGISDYVQKVANSNLDGQVSEIQRILSEKSLDDIEEAIMIKGAKDDKEQLTRVKGWTENANNQEWKVKTGLIQEKIQDEVTRISSEGRNIVQDDIIRVVAKELDANEKDVKVIVGEIVEEVVSSELVKNQKLEDAFALKILSQQSPDQVREKLETQITRMKKVMDQMKREMIKMQNEKAEREAGGDTVVVGDENAQAIQMKAALVKTMDALKGKERFVEKMKADFELLMKTKDQKVEKLMERIEEMKAEYARSREFANEEKLQQLEVENKSLMSRLDLANKKLVIVNDNIENRDNESLGKREKEVETLKTSMLMAQNVIERFKQDKLEMESRFTEEKEISRKLREERDAGTSSSVKNESTEKDTLIASMIAERKAIEDKYRAMSIELKKSEQKLKYTMSQLETSSKKRAATPPGQKSPELYAKQLDQANVRLSETVADVAEKRKEIIKLKQENSLMTSKLAELEKKFLTADKKAS